MSDAPASTQALSDRRQPIANKPATSTGKDAELVGLLQLPRTLIESSLGELHRLAGSIEELIEARQQFKQTIVRELSRKQIWKQDGQISADLKDRLQTFLLSTHEIIEQAITRIEYSFFRFFIMVKKLMDLEQLAAGSIGGAPAGAAGAVGQVDAAGGAGRPLEGDGFANSTNSRPAGPFQPFHFAFRQKSHGIQISRVLQNQDLRFFQKLIFQN